MNALISELQRRNVFKVAAAYLVVSWVVLQVAEFLAPLLRLPEWTVSLTLYLSITGFPFVLIFAWAFELTPEGLKRTTEVHPEESITSETGATLNRIIIGVLLVALGVLLAERLLLNEQLTEATGTPDTTEAASPRSIAVLPFVNMSNDPDQEYFSDGISEELLNSLAKITELRVAARTSAFAFKGKNQNVSDIGEQLNVETILEGSVRKSGERLRITAQLINVEDGYHLWSETYDRDLTDIFAIQDEISSEIVKALRVHLLEEEQSKSNPINVNAYNLYLLGKAKLRGRTKESLEESIKHFDRALEFSPEYADAIALKARAVFLLNEKDYGDQPTELSIVKAKELIGTAQKIDPNNAEAFATQGLVYTYVAGQEQLALDSINRAIELNPSSGIYYVWKSHVLDELGQHDESEATLRKAFSYDPLHPAIRGSLIGREVFSGNIDEARKLTTPGTPDYYKWEITIARLEGRHADVIRNHESLISVVDDREKSVREFQASYDKFFLLHDLSQLNSADPWLVALLTSSKDIERGYEILKSISEDAECPSVPHFCELVERGVTCAYWSNAGQFEKVLEYLRPFKIEDLISDDNHTYTGWYLYALHNLGEEVRVKKLLEAIKEHLAKVHHDQPYSLELSELHATIGDDEKAMTLLRQSWEENKAIDWADLREPWFKNVRKNSEFRALASAVYQHTNNERAKLGWAPVNFDLKDLTTDPQ